MITPQFDVEQEDDFIYVNIRAPYIKASMIQFEVTDDLFVFSLPPYYLRLRLPGHVIEDDRMESSYDLKTSTVRCKVAKLHPGEHFPELDMLTKLLATKQQQREQQQSIGPLIQEMDSDPSTVRAIETARSIEFDWEIEQEVPSGEESTAEYGFDNQYKDRVGISMHNGNDINELAEPETEASDKRRELLRSTTIDTFDPEHYWADFYDDEMIKDLLEFQFPQELEMTSGLKDRVVRLGHREHLLENAKQTYLGLVPLVFGWAYDFRTNLGDYTVESAWTVGKLVPGMCFLFNSYTSIQQVLVDCTARSLSKPLYRNWELTMKVWQDVLKVLEGLRKELLAVLARLLEIFESDLYAVYRQILIEDYTIWVQYASDMVINSMAHELKKALLTFEKSMVYLPLDRPLQGAADDKGMREPDSDNE